jgi:hypothetical protein
MRAIGNEPWPVSLNLRQQILSLIYWEAPPVACGSLMPNSG